MYTTYYTVTTNQRTETFNMSMICMDTNTKRQTIMDKLGVRELVTFDDILIYLRTKLGDASANVFAVHILPHRSPLTPFADQQAGVIDSIYHAMHINAKTKSQTQDGPTDEQSGS
jgi:hypothetical protein